MHKIFSYKLIALSMAFLMFSTSIGFSMDFHFCGDKLESISLFGRAEPCEMTQVKKEKITDHACCGAPKKEVKKCTNTSMENGSCCHHETLVLDNTGDIKAFDFSLEQVQQVIVLGVLFVPNFNLFEVSVEQPNYTHYRPPLISKDISILHQVFRI